MFGAKLPLFVAAVALWGCGSALEPATKSVSLAGGTIQANGPTGYCVDQAASQPLRNFAAFTPCAAIDRRFEPPAEVGFATVQVGALGSDALAEDMGSLRRFLLSPDGASLLTKSGDSSDIQIIAARHTEDQVILHFRDAGEPPLDGLQNQEWRAFEAVNGRLITVSVRGRADQPLHARTGNRLLRKVLDGVQPGTVLTPLISVGL